MSPYIITFILSLFFSKIAERSKNKVLFYIFSIVSILLPALLAGFRDDTIGTDINVYVVNIFNKALISHNIQDFFSDYTLEPIYGFLNYGISRITSDLFGILFAIELFILINIYWALSNLKKHLSITFGLFLYYFILYNESLNLMRQTMALSLCFLSFSFFITNRKKAAIIALTLALCSHSTSTTFIIPLFLLYYIRKKQVVKLNSLIYIYVISLPMIFLLYDFILSYIMSIGLLSSKFEMYLSNNTSTVVSTISIFTNIILLILSFYLYNLSSTYKCNFLGADNKQ